MTSGRERGGGVRAQGLRDRSRYGGLSAVFGEEPIAVLVPRPVVARPDVCTRS